jgi:hypothetical protein
MNLSEGLMILDQSARRSANPAARSLLGLRPTILDEINRPSALGVTDLLISTPVRPKAAPRYTPPNRVWISLDSDL